MLYEFADKGGVYEAREITREEISPDRITAGLITLDELEKYYRAFGFAETSVAECSSHDGGFRGSIDNYEDYSFGMLSLVDVEDVEGERDTIAFFLKKNLFLLVDVVDRDGSTGQVFSYVVQQARLTLPTPEKLIGTFFMRLLYRDFKATERFEFEIAAMEERMSRIDDQRAFNRRLLDMKKRLLILRNYYEQLVDIGEELQENENDLFRDDALRYFKLFTDKASRLSANVQWMREGIVQLREAYDASIDLSLNNIMKVLTVVTSVFQPLALIVGWYGMNFSRMPELTWEYGYAFVCGLSACVVALCFWLFKRKKLL